MAIRGLLCLVCKTRKKRWANGCCDRCHALVTAENTHKQFGVPKEPESHTRLRVRAKKYNKLALQGKSQAQIAEVLGLTLQQTITLAYRAKKVLDMKMFNMKTGQMADISPPLLKQPKRKRYNEHGGGKWGIKGCTCIPCTTVRQQTRLEYRENYKPRRRILDAQRRKSTRDKPS